MEEASAVLSPLGGPRAQGTFPITPSVSPQHFLLAGCFSLLVYLSFPKGKEIEPLAISIFLFVQRGIVAGTQGVKECGGSPRLYEAQRRHLETRSPRILPSSSSLSSRDLHPWEDSPGCQCVGLCMYIHTRDCLFQNACLKNKLKSSHCVKY